MRDELFRTNWDISFKINWKLIKINCLFKSVEVELKVKIYASFFSPNKVVNTDVSQKWSSNLNNLALFNRSELVFQQFYRWIKLFEKSHKKRNLYVQDPWCDNKFKITRRIFLINSFPKIFPCDLQINSQTFCHMEPRISSCFKWKLEINKII